VGQNLPANVARTYERIDREGTFHTDWSTSEG
jgi:6-phosphogluconate dehydrogenase